MEIPRSVLKGAKALTVGIAKKNSIAYGCAKAFREPRADLACAYLATPYVRRLSGETLFADGGVNMMAALRRESRNEPASPNSVVAENDVVWRSRSWTSSRRYSEICKKHRAASINLHLRGPLLK
jgi:hypothetical protein